MAESRDFAVTQTDEFYGRVTADMDDIIMRYRDERFNHLRYHVGRMVELEDGRQIPMCTIRALFMSTEALDVFAQAGVPEAYADVPTSTITNALEADNMARLDAQLSEEADN